MASLSPFHSPSISPVSPLRSPVIKPVSGVSSPIESRVSMEYHSGRGSPLLPSTSSISLLNLSFSQTSISELEAGTTSGGDSNSSSPNSKRKFASSSLSPTNTSRYVNSLQQSRISHYFSTSRRHSSSGLETTTEELIPDSPNLKPMSLCSSPSRLMLGEMPVRPPFRSPNHSPALRSPGSPALRPVTPGEEPMTPIVLED